jgi:hypothetical protein
MMRKHSANGLTGRWTVHRRGILTAWTCIALVTVGLCAAVAINRSLMSNAWAETRNCADAAALAGCRQLLTDDLLRDTNDLEDSDWRASECRNRAVEISNLYRGNRSIPPLRSDDIEVYQRQWNADREVYVPLTDSMYPNTVEVYLSNRNSAGPSGRMMGGGISGIGRGIISCKATATIHDQISGFRSGPGIAIPLAPLAIPESSQQLLAGTWSSTDDLESPDEYWWDEDSSELLDQSDGIAELAVTIRAGSSTIIPGQLLPVEICQSDFSAPVADRVLHGINHVDTSQAGLDQLSFPRPDSPHRLSDTDLDELADAFRSLIGHKRVFPLADLDHQSDGLTLTDVVAARILVVERGDDEVRILLQPTVMSTPAAVVSHDLNAQPNRYIRRIALLR